MRTMKEVRRDIPIIYFLTLRIITICHWHTPQAASTQPLKTCINGIGYVYGWFIEIENEVVSHDGSIPGYRSRIYKDLKKQLTVIILTNTGLVRPLDIITDSIIEVLNR